MVSSVIVLANDEDIVPPEAFRLIYSVFNPSPEGNVYGTVLVHPVQLVGVVHVPYAISLPAEHKIFVSETAVPLVKDAQLLIRYCTTSILIVLDDTSRLLPPFAVHQSSSTLKVNDVYQTPLPLVVGVYVI